MFDIDLCFNEMDYFNLFKVLEEVKGIFMFDGDGFVYYIEQVMDVWYQVEI